MTRPVTGRGHKALRAAVAAGLGGALALIVGAAFAFWPLGCVLACAAWAGVSSWAGQGGDGADP